MLFDMFFYLFLFFKVDNEIRKKFLHNKNKNMRIKDRHFERKIHTHTHTKELMKKSLCCY